eukprot:GHVP01033839.1.p1 GENE.GHVP01033839.1~~GHVP01033839.1.p1  ORF type:complete len:215 (-),score=38.14 GHVP01033839.1:675-1319(-)
MHSPLFLKIESLVNEEEIKSILLVDDSEITQEVLHAWYEKFTAPNEILPEEKKVIDDFACGTSSQYSWPTIKWIWARHFRLKLMSFPDEPLAMKNGLEIDVMLRILPQMLQLEVCPFSFQRMAELVQMEDKTYKSVDRWLYAIQRGLNVTVPSDPSEVVKPENSDVEMLEKIMQGLSEKFRTLLSEREYEPSASILSEESRTIEIDFKTDTIRI